MPSTTPFNENEPGGKRTRVSVRSNEALAEPREGPKVASAEALYREHHDFVWRNARRLGCSDDWVDDAVHEAFLVAARRLGDFEGHSSERTWLFAIVFRVVARMKRDRARYRKRLLGYAEARASSSPATGGAQDSAHYLRELLLRLDESRRAIVILIELEGMTAAEVGRALSLKQGTVESRLRSARLLLTKMIERDRARVEGRDR
jgi:RNA polymerase sigma-70 factor (ECF subfamily)